MHTDAQTRRRADSQTHRRTDSNTHVIARALARTPPLPPPPPPPPAALDCADVPLYGGVQHTLFKGFFFIGGALPGDVRPHHKSVFDFDEDAMLVSASMFLQICDDRLM